ncbi:MAG: aspartate kinase [Chloroflexi bacterium]|nr:aspartate kinase [Chloroflexota bacterium]
MAEKLIAQKFGGTSVASPESRQRVVGHIRRAVAEGYSPVVVVSAMGRRGAPYATDTLLDLIRAHGEPVDGRDEDLIFHCGEIISAAIMSHLLKMDGLRAVALTGGQARIYTDGRWRRSGIVRIDPSRLLEHVRRGEIPVVTGGQGVSVDRGDVTILGRGASDTSGVALGVAVGAEVVEIYTDVPGVAIADPRVVPQARFLKEIGYDSMYEMGIFGARVMHPGAVRIGQRGNVPVVCRSTFDDAPGTRIAVDEAGAELMGIPSLGPVELLAVRGGLPSGLRPEDVYDQYAGVAMKGADDVTVVAASPDWRPALESGLRGQGCGVERLAGDQSLVSLVGSAAFVTRSFGRAQSLLVELGIEPVFSEQAEIRSTFAVPQAEAPRVVRAFHETFAH